MWLIVQLFQIFLDMQTIAKKSLLRRSLTNKRMCSRGNVDINSWSVGTLSPTIETESFTDIDDLNQVLWLKTQFPATYASVMFSEV